MEKAITHEGILKMVKERIIELNDELHRMAMANSDPRKVKVVIQGTLDLNNRILVMFSNNTTKKGN